ncbi:hypothetical protein ACQ4M4_27545 [Leptolyngbya sp. AN02str]|uniref:hypothetical protein n=1 Tax=Leptolyngbya sp. AN02str TaxID=3423363 RepID=UPI003D319C84
MNYRAVLAILLSAGLVGCDRLPEAYTNPYGLQSASPTPAPSAIAAASQDAIAQPSAQPATLAQCRRTGRLERVYQTADLAAPVAGDIAAGFSVTVSGSVNQPSYGWIQISAPVNGYLQTPFLKLCETGQVLDCGIVVQPELAIKPVPTTESEPNGALYFEQGFRVLGTPVIQTEPPLQAGRVWVPIDRFGVTGWLTESAPDVFGTNFRRVPCRDINLEPAVG